MKAVSDPWVVVPTIWCVGSLLFVRRLPLVISWKNPSWPTRSHGHRHLVRLRYSTFNNNQDTTIQQQQEQDLHDQHRDIQSLMEWATYYGVQTCDGFELVSNSETGDVSVMTTVDLPAHSPVLYVPRDFIFSAHQARQEVSHAAAEATLRDYGVKPQYLHEFYLWLRILVEVDRSDDASAWAPWLHSLPRVFYNGVSMTDVCLDCLPPLVALLASEERSRFDDFYDVLQQQNNAIVSDALLQNVDLVTWAFQIVTTRSFKDTTTGATGDLKLTPLADMFNHGTDPEVVLTYDGEGNCCAYTTKDVKAGSPLTISYGDPTNPSYFLARYGFLDETAPATFCKIIIPNPSEQLVNMGYQHSQMLFFKENGEASQSVYDVLLYQILGREDPAEQYALYEAHVQGDDATKFRLHNQYAVRTVAALRKHVDSFLLQLDALSAEAAEHDVRQHPRLPLILRHNEFVRETFTRVQARLNEG